MKTKVQLLLAFAVAVLCSCTTSFNYNIEGETIDLPQITKLLLVSDMESGVPFDTLSVKDGRFSYEGTADSVTTCFIGNLEDSIPMLPFFIEEGTIKIVLGKDHKMAKTTGTPLNEELQKLNEAGFKFQDELTQLVDSFKSEITEEQQKLLEKKSYEGMQKLSELFYKTAEKNINNELGYFLVANPTILSEEQEMVLINKLPAKTRKRAQIQEIEKYLKGISGSSNDMAANDGKIPNFSAPDQNGKMLSAMDVISQNKLTIIDFWASWCGPCMKEMPHMVQLFKLYNTHGLGILGVSLDTDETAWKDAIKQTGAIWHHICERKQNSDIAKMFGVNAIPFTMIVDQEGNVLASGLTGTDLEDFLRNNLTE